MMLGTSARWLLHPLLLGSVVLWGLNDHLLKAAFPGFVTGKLSDLAALAVAPVLVVGWVELLSPQFVRRRALGIVVLASVLAATAMALINLVEVAAEAYRWTMGLMQWPYHWLAFGDAAGKLGESRAALTMDVGDALTAPAALLPIWLVAKRSSR
jgi:hypothetical protein